jgi:hypothetical protein
MAIMYGPYPDPEPNKTPETSPEPADLASLSTPERNLTPSEELISVAIATPHSGPLAMSPMLINPILVPPPDRIVAVNNNADSNPAPNQAPGAGPTARDLASLSMPERNLTESIATALQNPNQTPTPQLIAAAIENPYSSMAFDVGHHPKLPLTAEILASVRGDPNTYLALGVGHNPNLALTDALLAVAIANPKSNLALGLKQNPNVPLLKS